MGKRRATGLRHLQKPDCGTRSGYDYHRRVLLENPCLDCQEAERWYHKNRRQVNNRHINDLRKVNRQQKPYLAVRSAASVAELIEAYGDNCYLCNKPIDFKSPTRVGSPGWEFSFHPDHVIPLSKGGPNIIENIRPSHAQCNIRKASSLGNPNLPEYLKDIIEAVRHIGKTQS